MNQGSTINEENDRNFCSHNIPLSDERSACFQQDIVHNQVIEGCIEQICD